MQEDEEPLPQHALPRLAVLPQAGRFEIEDIPADQAEIYQALYEELFPERPVNLHEMPGHPGLYQLSGSFQKLEELIEFLKMRAWAYEEYGLQLTYDRTIYDALVRSLEQPAGQIIGPGAANRLGGPPGPSKA